MSMTNTETIQSLINSGEGYNVEFKVRIPSKVRELTEEICAFANADGGYLLIGVNAVSYTHLRAHETRHDLVCRLLLEKKKNKKTNEKIQLNKNT